MRYENLRTRTRVELGDLSDEERSFYARALDRFERNVHWLSFEEFAFSPRSPIYSSRRSHLDVIKDPLYLALRDMAMQLGVQQGLIAASQRVKPAAPHRASPPRPGTSSQQRPQARAAGQHARKNS